MKNTVIETSGAPKAFGPYSQAIRAGPTLYISGQLGMDPATMEFVPGKAPGQTERALMNIENIVKKAGGSMKDIVNVTVLLENIEDFAEVNKVYEKFFPCVEKEGDVPPPARACFAVKGLPKNASVEITAIAYICSMI